MRLVVTLASLLAAGTLVPSAGAAGPLFSPLGTLGGTGIVNNMTTADFNGDGAPDVAVTDSGAGTLSLFFGNGRGGFTQWAPGPLAVGPGPGPIVSGAFHGGGIADLAIAETGGTTVTVLLGNGQGGFAPAPGSPIDVGAAPTGLAVVALTGSTKPALAVTTTADKLVVLVDNGSGKFTPAAGSPIQLPAAITPGQLVAFTAGGVTDLALIDQSSWKVEVLIGNGNGGFTPRAGGEISAGQGMEFPESIVTGDFNGDGKADLALGFEGGLVSVLLGNGAGGFAVAPGSPATVAPAYTQITGLAVGDFNGDGKRDLAAAAYWQGGGAGTANFADWIAVELANAQGQLTPAAGSPYELSGVAQSVLAGAFAGDGRTDLLASDSYSCSGSTVELLGNQGPNGAAAPTSGYPGDGCPLASAGSKMTITPSTHNCSVPCESAFIAQLTNAQGQPEPNVPVQFTITNSGGQDLSTHVLYGINPSPLSASAGLSATPNVSQGVTNADGEIALEVAADGGQYTEANAVPTFAGTFPGASSTVIVPALGLSLPASVSITATSPALGPSTVSASAAWNLSQTTIARLLLRPSQEGVSVDSSAFTGVYDPNATLAAFAFDPYGNQYHFGVSISAKIHGTLSVTEPVTRFISGSDNGYNPDCGGDIVCTYEVEISNRARNGFIVQTSQVISGWALEEDDQYVKLGSITELGDPKLAAFGALIRVTPLLAANGGPITGNVNVFIAAQNADGTPVGAFPAPLAPQQDITSADIDFGKSIGTGLSGAAKADTLKRIDIAGAQTTFACAGGLLAGIVFAPETVGTSALLAAYLGCGSSVLGFAGTYVAVSDPPVGGYGAVALPRSVPGGKLTSRVCAVLKIGSTCAALLRSGAAYRAAASKVASLQEALAIALDRYAGAIQAKAFFDAGAQRGAARAITGELLGAIAAERKVARRLAKLIGPARGFRTSEATMERIRSRLLRAFRTLRDLPGWLIKRLLSDGLAPNRKRLSALLVSAVKRSAPRSFTVGQMLAPNVPTRGEVAYAHATTPSELASLVITLIDQGAVRGVKATSALYRASLPLEQPNICTASGRKEASRALAQTVRRYLRGAARALLNQALANLPAARRGKTATGC